jgi:arylsulfatase A-like enzyme
MRSLFIGLAAALLVAGCATAQAAETKVTANADILKKPNIIFILADDLGWGDVGFNGQDKIKTPNLDRMAREGIVLSQHYAGSPVCMPSRAALLTGKHMGHASTRGNPGWTTSGKAVDLDPQDVTVAEELKRAGYTTAVIGKWGMAEAGMESMPGKQGFDYFFGHRKHGPAHHYYPATLWRNDEEFPLPGNKTREKIGQYSHDLFTKEALKFVQENKSKPFFLYLAYTIPHLELTVPEDSKRPYLGLGWPEQKMSSGHYYNDPEGNTTYAGMISRMDRDIGRLLDLLKAQGIAENTLVIFSSDNGPEYEKEDRFFNSNGPFRGGKRDLYEGGIRMPFVARWPGKIPAGARSDHVSAFWDFLPTACDVAGIQPTGQMDGISYLPALLGKPEQQKEHEYLYWEFNENQGPIQAVRAGQWKAVRFLGRPLELYDLSKNPGEEKNVAPQNPDVVARMTTIMANARTEHPEFPLRRIQKKKGAKQDAE